MQDTNGFVINRCHFEEEADNFYQTFKMDLAEFLVNDRCEFDILKFRDRLPMVGVINFQQDLLHHYGEEGLRIITLFVNEKGGQNELTA